MKFFLCFSYESFSPEANLCEEVACYIKKLCPISFTPSPGIVGIDSLAEQIISYLCIGELDVRYVGLWGIGGIGKTTMAEFVYAKISNHFDNHCIFRDVREKSEKFDLLHLRRSFISLLLGGGAEDIQGLNELPTDILDELGEKKILVVLDDLNNLNQLEALGISDSWFGPGSRIIITSRDKNVLHNGGVNQIYQVEGLGRTHASKLLMMKAFPKTDPDESYTSVLNSALDYCNGVPLALKVLGSQLCKKSPQECASLMENLQQYGDPDIMAILKISYDTLKPMEEKIFLDVACFYKGCGESWMKRTLYSCDCSSSSDCCCLSNWALLRLKEKCLVTIDDDMMLGMHDLIEKMGQGMARKKGSRLWESQDICHLLKTDKENAAVEGIVFDTDEMRKIQLHPQAFSMMPNLRILQFQPWQKDKHIEFILKSKQSNHLPSLSDNLRLIYWPNYPFKSLPSSFSMENLVELRIGRSNITRLWNGNKCPQNLKSLFLHDCQELVKLPDLSSATKLCSMVIRNCTSLEEINPSIKCLLKLIILDLRGCESLISLPSLFELESLNTLILSECSNLKRLPNLPKRIQKLRLDNSGVEEWSSSIQCLECLELVSMRSCTNITTIPSNILLSFNEEIDGSGDDDYYSDDDVYYNDDDCIYYYKLDFSRCWYLHSLPKIKGYLLEVNLYRVGIEELPLLDELVFLKKFNLRGCSKLVGLPSLDGLISLESLDLEGCSKVVRLPSLDSLSSLRMLNLKCCSALVELPRLDGLVSLEKLDLTSCSALVELPSLSGLVALKKLDLAFFSAVVEFSSLDSLVSLEELDLRVCSKLAGLSPLHGLSHLQVLNLGWNDTLVEIPDDIVSLSWLRTLSVRECKQLQYLPKLPEQLTKLQVVGCTSLVNVASTPNRERFYGYYELNYINCINLNQNTRSCIMADAHSVAKQLGIVAKKKFEHGGYKVGIAGSEIPEWVLNQSQGSSIEIDFTLNRSNIENLLGFVFLAVLDFHPGTYSWLDLRIEVNSCFKNAAGDDEKNAGFLYTFRDINAVPRSDHVFLLYNSRDWTRTNELQEWVVKNGSDVKGTFNFIAFSVGAPRYINVKKCGAFLIHE